MTRIILQTHRPSPWWPRSRSRRSSRVSSDQAPPVNVPGIDKPVIVVTGEVTGTETWTSSIYYVLRGAVFVRDGGTLNIAAGTRVIGEAGSVGTLIVERGGRLNAIGTPRAADRVHERPAGRAAARRGDWGGLIINGRAPVNIPGGEGEGEADTGVYGGDHPNDNSGTLRYVRVEFAGVEFSPDNELNGIAFQGVGRGGVVRVHPGAHEPRRRARVVRRHGRHQARRRRPTPPTTASTGRSAGPGGPQFVAIHQRGDDADNGIEADNNEFDNNFLPRVEPADLQHHDVRRPRPQRGRREQPRDPVPPRHGRHVPQLPGHRLQDDAGCRSTTRPTLTQVNNGTTQIGAGVIWGISTDDRIALERRRRSSQRTLPRRPPRRRRRPVDPSARTTTTRTSSPRRRRRSPAASSRRFSRPTTGSSSR